MEGRPALPVFRALPNGEKMEQSGVEKSIEVPAFELVTYAVFRGQGVETEELGVDCGLEIGADAGPDLGSVPGGAVGCGQLVKLVGRSESSGQVVEGGS